jgi:predicted ATP-grasp superfamily ATP-dependent carboligase
VRKILILDGAQRSALAAVRALGGQGVPLRVADVSGDSLAGRSKFARESLAYADPSVDAGRCLDDILRASPADSGELILPMTDATTMLLVADGRFAGRLLCPQVGAYESLSDKGALLERARGLGVPVPRTDTVRDLDQAQIAIAGREPPIVIKPARSRYLSGGAIRSTSVIIAATRASAIDALKAAPWFGTLPALIQDYVPGTGAGVFALFDDGRPVTWFAHRRLREKPPEGGVSVLSESARADPRLIELSTRILGSVDWSGVAMVEFRIGSDGVPYLMEVNARFWGSLQLAVDSGVNFPWLLYRMACGEQVPEVSDYRVGQRLHWFLGDLDNLLIQIRSRRSPRTPAQKLAAIGAFLGACVDFKARAEVARWSDPRPALYECRHWLAALRGGR